MTCGKLPKTETVYDLIRGLDVLARRLLSERPLGISYIVGAVITTYTWFVLCVIIYLQEFDQLIGAVNILTGVVGISMFFGVVTYSLYKVNAHLELVSYYFMHLRDIIVRFSEVNDEKLTVLTEDIALTKRVRLEYSPVALVFGYLALIAPNMFFSLGLFVVFVAVLAVFVYKGVNIMQSHIGKENILVEEIIYITGFNLPSFKTGLTCVGRVYVIGFIVSLGALLLKCIVDVNSYLDTHIVEHRIVHEELKKFILLKTEAE